MFPAMVLSKRFESQSRTLTPTPDSMTTRYGTRRMHMRWTLAGPKADVTAFTESLQERRFSHPCGLTKVRSTKGSCLASTMVSNGQKKLIGRSYGNAPRPRHGTSIRIQLLQLLAVRQRPRSHGGSPSTQTRQTFPCLIVQRPCL